jgi:hypothetical protein
MTGRSGRARRWLTLIGHSAAVPVETDARAGVTVVDLTGADWLGPGRECIWMASAFANRAISFATDTGQRSAGPA